MTTDMPARAAAPPSPVGGANLCNRLLHLAEDLDGAGCRAIAEHLVGLAYRLLDSFPAPAVAAPDAVGHASAMTGGAGCPRQRASISARA